MLATLSKLSLMDPNLATGIIGKSIADVQALDWYQNWNQANLMFVSDFNGNGTLELNEFFMGGKAVVLATPEIAGLPYVCLLYTSPSPRDTILSRMPSSA